MVDDAIAEIRRPDFPRLRARHHEADRAAGPIAAVEQISVQLAQVALELLLEGEGVVGVAFVSPAVEVGDYQLFERSMFRTGLICGRRGRETRCSCGCCSGCHH
ncbi:hypothetical protein D3C72_2137660 [compost metagenome]